MPESTTVDDKPMTIAEQRGKESHLERLTPIELLSLLFEEQERRVLELVLEGCNGQLLKAIEYFVCIRQSARRKCREVCERDEQREKHQESRVDFSMNTLLSNNALPMITYPAPFREPHLIAQSRSAALDLSRVRTSSCSTHASLSASYSTKQ